MKELRIDEFLLKQVVNDAGSAILITDLRGAIKYVNPRFSEITGYAATEVLGKTPRLLNSGNMPPSFYRDLWQTISGGRRWRGRVMNKRKDGSCYWSQQSISPVRDRKGKTSLYLSLSEDVTESESLKQQYKQLAFFDELTGLGNRRMFQRDLDMRIDFASRADDLHMLMLINIDDFKSFNEQLGHNLGNQILKNTARKLRQTCVSPGDIYRLGADEFALLGGPFRHLEQAQEAVDELAQQLRQSEEEQDQQLKVELSMGVALFPRDSMDASELMRQAEIAMGSSRISKENACIFYHDELNARYEADARLLSDLVVAIDQQQISLVGQPIIALHSGEVRMLEILLRWQHPRLGYISPPKIIQLAEDFGCLHRLSLVIVDQLIETIKSLGLVQSPINFSINLNVAQALDGGLIDYLCERLDEISLPCQRIMLELVESDQFNYADARTRQRIQLLKDRGFQLALDDFGSGYATFEFINEIDPDCIKIDRGITADIESRGKKWITLDAILALTERLGVTTVVEGVESAAQDSLLRDSAQSELLVQGYLYSQPQPLIRWPLVYDSPQRALA